MTAPKLATIDAASSLLMDSLTKQYAKIEAQNGVVFVRVCCTVIGTSELPTIDTTTRTQPSVVRVKKIFLSFAGTTNFS